MPPAPKVYPIRFRRGTAAEWASKNPVVPLAEPAYESDTGYFKIGDGETLYNDLEYFRAGPVDQVDFLALLQNHRSEPDPHPVWDDGPSLTLLYENKKV